MWLLYTRSPFTEIGHGGRPLLLFVVYPSSGSLLVAFVCSFGIAPVVLFLMRIVPPGVVSTAGNAADAAVDATNAFAVDADAGISFNADVGVENAAVLA